MTVSAVRTGHAAVDGPPRRLTLSEYSRRAYPPLPRAVADALATIGAVTVSADLDGRTVLTSTSQVGIVRVGGVELRVTPKTSISRLLWLVGHAQDPSGWRDDDLLGLTDAEDLTTGIAVSFLAAANRALSGGILQGYRTLDEALPLVRGRIREADQLRRRLGLVLPVEVRYDDFTTDIAENRLLLAATLRLLRVPGVPVTTRTGLRRLRMLLADVTAPVAGEPSAEVTSSRLTHRYQPALHLARLVLAGRSIEHPVGSLHASGFLFNLNKVFEDWLTAALGRSARCYGGELRPQRPTNLDTDGRVRMFPDIVWQVGGRPAAVLDAKYKRVVASSWPNGDLYQMHAYCTALDLRAGHLVYAAGDHRPSRHIVRNSGVTLHTWALDLCAPVSGLLAQVDALMAAVVRSSQR